MRLVLATRNDHKVRELARLLDGVAVEPLPAEVDAAARGRRQFAANALGKARAAAAALGRPAIADDSGIEAAALGGRPGSSPRASRARTPPTPRTWPSCAPRRPRAPGCATSASWPTRSPAGRTRTFTGVCDGTLAADARGTGGFGYDPAFLPAGVDGGRTMAELSDAEKDAISHRGHAARALLAWLRDRERAS